MRIWLGICSVNEHVIFEIKVISNFVIRCAICKLFNMFFCNVAHRASLDGVLGAMHRKSGAFGIA
jgi:hypothetical protein